MPSRFAQAISIGEARARFIGPSDLFSYIGGFSGASGLLMTNAEKPDMKAAFHGALADPAAFSKRVHLAQDSAKLPYLNPQLSPSSVPLISSIV